MSEGPVIKICFRLFLTLCLQVSSADNFCKQFGARSGPTKCPAWSGSKLFDTLLLFLKEFFENIDFEKKISADDQNSSRNYAVGKELKETDGLWYFLIKAFI